MVNVRLRKDTGKLFLDFRYQGRRCREYTDLTDTATNRRALKKVAKKIEADIKVGTFDYAKYFPNSRNLVHFQTPAPEVDGNPVAEAVSQATGAPGVGQVPMNGAHQGAYPMGVNPDWDAELPTFADFADTWFAENEVRWRHSHRKNMRIIIEGRLKPAFGEKRVSRITKAEILAFRSNLAKESGRKGKPLSPKRINSIMMPLRQILDEAADRYEFTTPYRNIKSLKVPRTHVEPFSLDEVQQILARVRADFRPYYTVRFFTGMRTGEIDGLKWEYVDFENRLILVRETRVDGREEYTKTDGSQREIQMSQPVYEALKEQEAISRGHSRYVFCTREGNPLDHNNVTKRVWYPLLRHLGLKKRRPYQTRHTAATLWLAAGENPEWIARQMGHTSTEMLFRVYSRYVPNLTRRDGSAFERLLTANFQPPSGMGEERNEKEVQDEQ